MKRVRITQQDRETRRLLPLNRRRWNTRVTVPTHMIQACRIQAPQWVDFEQQPTGFRLFPVSEETPTAHQILFSRGVAHTNLADGRAQHRPFVQGLLEIDAFMKARLPRRSRLVWTWAEDGSAWEGVIEIAGRSPDSTSAGTPQGLMATRPSPTGE